MLDLTRYHIFMSVYRQLDCREEIELKSYMPSKLDMKNLTTFFYAFSDDTRLKIIMLLSIKPLCVGGIAQVLNQNQTTVSHQLKILKSINIVSCDRSGKNIVYYIKNPSIETVLNVSVDCI